MAKSKKSSTAKKSSRVKASTKKAASTKRKASATPSKKKKPAHSKPAIAKSPRSKSARSESPRSESTGEQEVSIDRRRSSERRAQAELVASQQPAMERREKVNRRRQIDPTTCERDYSLPELEFMNAMDEYKRSSGRMFPTCSEVLEVIRDLGYVKQDAPVKQQEAPVKQDAMSASDVPVLDVSVAVVPDLSVEGTIAEDVAVL